MSNITYNRNKVEQFKIAFQEFQSAKENFKEEMQQFQATMDFMSGANDDNLADEANTGSGSGYVINEKGILMKVEGSSDTTYDSSVNNVVDIGSKKAFVTDVKYQGNADIDETNKLYQVGLADLTYISANENVVSEDYKYITTTNDPTITMNTDCNLNHLSQCSAKAKMENKSYYGIEGGTDVTGTTNICNCFIFDEQPTDVAPERIKTIQVAGDSDNTAYLATLMDGNFYKLKNGTYSDNYSGFYEYDTENDNIQQLIDGGYGDNGGVGLNPFVGNGINSIAITELGKSSCAPIV